MILAFVLILSVLLYYRYNTDYQVHVQYYTTQYFQKDSKDVFMNLQEGYKKKFAVMEDTFLYYEKMTVCQGIDMHREAEMLHEQMMEEFPTVDLSHHQVHLDQMKNPNEYVNKHLSC